MRIRYFAAFAVVMAGSAALSHAAASETSAKAVAYVNGKAITERALGERVEQLYPSMSVHGKQGGSSELRQKAVDELVLEELIWQRAVKLGQVTPYEKSHAEMLRVRRACGRADFDAGLRMKGITRAQYTRTLQRSLTIELARKRHGSSTAKVTLAEARAFYDGNPGRFHRPERARIRLILVGVDQDAKSDAVQAARSKADALYAQLKAGKDFGEVAWEASDDMYRVKGGDVGWMHKGSMDPEFEPLAFSLPIGEITKPFRTPPGFSIMRVDAREPAKDMSFDEVRETLTAQLVAKKSKELQQQWELSLKKGARIEMVAGEHPVQASAGLEMVVPSH